LRDSCGGKSPKTERIVEILLTHPTLQAAAKALKVSYVTLWRRMRDETVRARLLSACRDSMQQSLALLQATSIESIECLRGLLRGAESESVQASVAKTLLEMGLKAAELSDLEERISRLEILVKTHNSKGRPNDDQPQPPAPAGATRDSNGRG
jgi:hypothetical protein